MAFDASFARDVVLPLARAAYDVMGGGRPDLPSGYQQTGLIEVDTSVRVEARPAVRAMLNDNIFGLLGRDAGTRTAFVAFRGTQDLQDWLHDLDAETEDYAPITGFGMVHAGFQAAYRLVRDSIAAEIATACTGCDRLLITGHSLGAALAVLAAPDIFRNMPPGTIEPRLVTFAGPCVGLPAFVASFNRIIESCFRVVNFLDIVPHLPWWPYEHVGAAVDVDSGGDISVLWRHSLQAYADGLAKLA